MDTGRALRKLWKVPKTLMVLDGRVTYIIDKEGVCRGVYQDSVKPTAHIDQALAVLRGL
jgi:thioredoxin-dependent peroxiredoxin